jgi:3-methylcrotonyl-CoA carboxylase beta subunit
LLPRERSSACSIPALPFLEIGQLAANGLYNDEVPGAGVIAGIGRVSGRQCMVFANDATVKGGTYYPMTVKKHLRAQEIAQENRLPCIYLVDSGGANLPNQAEVFPDREHFGRIFYNQARMSASGIAQIAAVMGSCTAGGAYVPAMSDETVIVGTGHDLPGRAAAGQGRDGRGNQRRRPGRRRSARAQSGVVDLAENDDHALSIVRDVVSHLGPAETARVARRESRPPLHDPQDLYSVIPQDVRAPYDVREVIARLVDGSEFHEFKALFGTTLVCGFAHVLACRWRSWPTTACCSQSAQKGAHFIELACQRGIPLLFLQNISASWSAASMRPRASPSTGPSWSPPWPRPMCPRSPC